MTSTISMRKKKSIVLIAALLLTAFALSAVSESASAISVFNPLTFSHNDGIDKYDDYNEILNDTVFGPSVYLNTHSTTMERRYGAYVRGPSDTHQYMGFRLANTSALSTLPIPTTILSVYADPGIVFEVYDAQNNLILNSANSGMGQPAEVLKRNVSNYSSTNKVFYFIELAPKPATGRLSNFRVVFETSVNANLHYSMWFGVPLFAESRMSMSVPMRSITNPTTTSSTVTTTPMSGAVPARSWISSVRYNINVESNRSNVSLLYDGIMYPGHNKYQRILSGNTYALSVNNTYGYGANGTYTHRFDGIMWSSGSSGRTYSNMATCIVTYYYMFGSGDYAFYH